MWLHFARSPIYHMRVLKLAPMSFEGFKTVNCTVHHQIRDFLLDKPYITNWWFKEVFQTPGNFDCHETDLHHQGGRPPLRTLGRLPFSQIFRRNLQCKMFTLTSQFRSHVRRHITPGISFVCIWNSLRRFSRPPCLPFRVIPIGQHTPLSPGHFGPRALHC